ncbi:MAG: FG-GAP-like repeat-containing protein [Bacteroidota bacterium]
MKMKLLLPLLLLAQIVQAQSFSELPQSPPLMGVEFSSIALADVDGDTDQDLIITGLGDAGPSSTLYLNDGSGQFTKLPNPPFSNVLLGAVAFADIDGDEDQDLLITGLITGPGPIAELYVNDGTGQFTEAERTPFEGVENGSIAFADIDNDEDQDVLITGNTGSRLLSRIYLNDGLGQFSNALTNPLAAMYLDAVGFADVNNDQAPDLLMIGQSSTNGKVAQLRLNNGSGEFALQFNTPFEPFVSGALAFADVDGDEDQDVCITSPEPSASGGRISKLYTNDGFGLFTEMADSSLRQVAGEALAFADLDQDGDQDLLLTGKDQTKTMAVSKLYINDGTGRLTEVMDSIFEDVSSGSVAFADIDGDGDQDVLMTGRNNAGEKVAKIYRNNALMTSTVSSPRSPADLLTIHPNPITNKELHIDFGGEEMEAIDLSIFDLQGRLLIRQKETLSLGQLTVRVDALQSGQYVMECRGETGWTAREQFVILSKN